MASSKDMTLTSVKVKADLFENFKIECVKRKFSFQKLADRSLYLYLTNEDFRKQINSQVDKGFKVGKLNNILYIQVMKDHGLLVEKYRPTNIDNYVGNESIKKSISNYISQNDIQNLIFYGPAGTGKTTLAKLIVKNIDCDHIYINASDERGIETIRDKVSGFASVMSFKPLKVVILDEADFLTIQAQASLRNVID